MSGTNNYTLRLGEHAKVRPAVFKSSESVIYSGKLSENIYSIVVSWTFGYNSMAYNLFFSKQQKEIFTIKGRLEIDYVSSEEIRFSYSEVKQINYNIVANHVSNKRMNWTGRSLACALKKVMPSLYLWAAG